MSTENILEAFVNIGAQGLEETEEALSDFVARAKKILGSLSSSAAGAGVFGPGFAAGLSGGLERAVDRAAKAAQTKMGGVSNMLRNALLEFGREKDLLSLDIRLLNDDDLNRQLADITSKVNAAAKDFRLAEPGAGGNSAREASLEQINSLRQNELELLRQISDEQIKERGLGNVQNDRASAFMTAKQAAQEFGIELKEIGQIVSKSGSPKLKEDFEAIRNEASRLRLDLTQSVQRGDLVNAQGALAELNKLRTKLKEFRDTAQGKIIINTNADDISEQFDKLLSSFRRQSALDASLTRGSSMNAQQKKDLAEAKKLVADIVDEFQRLDKEAEKTASQIQRMNTLLLNLDDAAGGIREIYSVAKVSGGSFNTLSNNVYQLGQAFEDAAVGYQLNGVAGAFRGAANNVSFLINDLSRLEAIQIAVGEKWASWLPLIAGVGSAVAILLVPPLVEWLATLDDIQIKTRDIAKDLRNFFDDVRFEIGLQVDTDSFIEVIQMADDAEAALAAVVNKVKEAKDIEVQLRLTLVEFEDSSVLKAVQDSLTDIQKITQEKLKALQETRTSFLSGGSARQIQFKINNFDEEAFRKFSRIQNDAEIVSVAINQSFEKLKRGFVPVGELESARAALRELERDFKSVEDSGFVNAKGAAVLKANLEAARAEVETLTKEAAKLSEILDSIFDRGLAEATAKASQLSAEYKFLQDLAAGRATKEDEIFLKFQQQTEELERQFEKIKILGEDDPRVDALINANKENLAKEQQIDLLVEIRDLEEDIANQQERGEKAVAAAEKRRADLEKRFVEAQIKGAKEIADAEENLQKELIDQQSEDYDRQLRKRIDDLRKLDRDPQKFQLGDTQQIVFGDDVKSEIQALEQVLKDRQEADRKNADRERIKELQDRIREEQEEYLKRIEDLREDIQEAREREIEAVENAAEEMRKLTDQLKKFQEGVQNIQNNANAVGAVPANEIFRNPGFEPADFSRVNTEVASVFSGNMDFRSSSLQTTLSRTNTLLDQIDASVNGIDIRARTA